MWIDEEEEDEEEEDKDDDEEEQGGGSQVLNLDWMEKTCDLRPEWQEDRCNVWGECCRQKSGTKQGLWGRACDSGEMEKLEWLEHGRWSGKWY